MSHRRNLYYNIKAGRNQGQEQEKVQS